MDFRDRLREEIEYMGLLDKEVAEKAGISKRAIDSYVSANPSMPSADVAVRLAKVLGTTVEYLVDGKNNAQNYADKDLRRLISIFYKLSERDKTLLLSLAKIMYETKSDSPIFNDLIAKQCSNQINYNT